MMEMCSFIACRALAHRGATLTIVDTAGGWSDACRGAMAAADFCWIPARPSPADIEAAAPTLAAVRAKRQVSFVFALNQVEARSTRLNGAAGSLGERAVARGRWPMCWRFPQSCCATISKTRSAWGLVSRNTRRAEIGRGDPRPMAMGLGAAKPRLAARSGSAAPRARNFARRGAAGRRASSFVRHRLGARRQLPRFRGGRTYGAYNGSVSIIRFAFGAIDRSIREEVRRRQPGPGLAHELWASRDVPG